VNMINLRGAFSPNPRLKPLLEGSISIPGVSITWQSGSPADLHLLHLTENPCDIFEFSLSNYMITRDRPADRERLQWMALPIFFFKAFMWFRVFVHRGSGITSLADLRGKRVGVPDYHMTAAVWMRIVLKELYGIGAADIEWFNGRPPSVSHGAAIGERLMPGITLTQATREGEIAERLKRGDLDAAYESSDGLIEAGPVRPLFVPGDAERIIGDFRRKTGMTPTNHVLLVQQALIDQYPEMTMQLYRAFEASKQEAYDRARTSAPCYLLFAKDTFARQAALFGDDPFPSGLAANRDMLTFLAHALVGEGLLGGMPDIDGLFCEALRST
jgi:4,5-dihydroxyphthalate decarboxylase